MATKEQVVPDFIEMMKSTRAYGELADEEKETIEALIRKMDSPWNPRRIKGSYHDRKKQLESVCIAFMVGRECSNRQKKPLAASSMDTQKQHLVNMKG